jgi:hypothetical protein
MFEVCPGHLEDMVSRLDPIEYGWEALDSLEYFRDM